MRKTIFFFALLSTSLTWGNTTASPQVMAKFCQDRLSSVDGVQKVVANYSNQLGFYNQGGILGSGVCWWHSRFTRAAAYLAVFDPSLPRPTKQEAKVIISHLRKRKGIITIGGFPNLQEFSYYHGEEILNKLNDWQRSDGIFKAAWMKGLSGSSTVTAETLESKMDKLYEQVSQGSVVYQMLQLPGVMAHSWLVVGMEKNYDGYALKVVDSNTGGVSTFNYRRGMTNMSYYYYGNFVPYTGQENEEENLKAMLTEACDVQNNLE